jgi:hypothetical protein
MSCDFYVWRVRHPSKIARRCFRDIGKEYITLHFFRETVAFIFSACTRAEKLTPHLNFLRDLRVLLFKLFSYSGFLHFPISLPSVVPLLRDEGGW